MVIKYGTLQKALREDPACHPGKDDAGTESSRGSMHIDYPERLAQEEWLFDIDG